jgi:hypothetical protein
MGSMRTRSKRPTSRASLMGPAKASQPAAAGDAISAGRAGQTCVVSHTIAGESAAVQR